MSTLGYSRPHTSWGQCLAPFLAEPFAGPCSRIPRPESFWKCVSVATECGYWLKGLMVLYGRAPAVTAETSLVSCDPFQRQVCPILSEPIWKWSADQEVLYGASEAGHSL